MAKTAADRRRKRRSSTKKEAETPSSFPLIVLLAVLFVLSVPLDVFNRDWLLIERDEGPSQQTQQRRFLLNGSYQENVWKKQPRVQEKGVKKSMATGDIASDGDGRRMALIPRYADKHHFEECVGKTIAECQVLIDTFVAANPEQFNNQTTLLLDIRKMRELTDDSYYKVVLRTNLDGSEVYGIFDDGMVYYPWPWRVEGEDKTIGPWDCGGDGGGGYLSPPECCQMIQEDVVWQDDNQHYLACFVEEPVGGPNNPEREDRAIVVIDSKGVVVRSPRAH